MKRAFVHDWLLGIAGGEKVLSALVELFDGPIYTLLKDPSKLEGTPLAGRKIHASFLQYLPRVQSYYRNLLPLFPTAIERFDLSSYDLILSSSHCVAKGVRTHDKQLHICYCHTPIRYAWDLHDFHLSHLKPLKKAVAKPLLQYMRQWDQKTHTRVDHFIANSANVAKRIERIYERPSTVIHPPVDTHLFQISPKRDNYYFTCSRLVPYKRIDLLVQAFAALPHERLLIVGDGPEMRKLKVRATPNVELLGHLPDNEMRALLSQSKAFLFAAEEDFGIAPVEAQAAGIPVIAYGSGGSLETVLPGQTGIFFKEQTVPSLLDALERFKLMQDDFEPETIKKLSERFSKSRFQSEISKFIQDVQVSDSKKT